MTEQTRRATRLLEIERLLRIRPLGWKTSELAIELQCSARTIQRDLAVLESELNTPLVEDSFYYRLIEDAQPLAPLRLTLQEARALLMATRLYFKNTDRADPDGASALTKIHDVLPASAAVAIGLTIKELRQRTASPVKTRVIRTLTEAWATARDAVIECRSHDNMSYRETALSPYLVEPGEHGSTYVIGASSEHPQNAVRTFKVDRVRAATLTKQPFEAPQDALEDLVEKLSDSWSIVFTDDLQSVVVDFTAAVADHVGEAVWHPSQQLEPLPDGGVRLRVSLPHLMEFIPWLRTWGADALAVAPPELRDEVARSLSAAAARYQ